MCVAASGAKGPRSVMRAVFWTALYGGLLAALLVLTGKLDEVHAFEFMTPYKRYLVLVEVLVLGLTAVEHGSKAVYGLALQRTSPGTAAAVRILVRILALGVILSSAVSILTGNAAAALTLGGFAGLVAGFGTQTLMNHAIAGLFLAIARPLRVGDRVTIGLASGTVKSISLMHTVLETEDREFMVPSSSVLTQVLVRHLAT